MPSSGVFERALARFKALPFDERAALLPEPPKPKPAAMRDPDAGIVRWTTRERALMAAGVDLLRKEDGFGDVPLADLYIKAQGMILPADRQRSEAAIRHTTYGKNASLQRHHDEGIADAWKFPDTANPFRLPPAEIATAPAPAPAPAPAAPEAAPADMPGAVVLFGHTMMSALDALLRVRDAQMAQDVARSIAEQTATLSERIGPLVQSLLQVQVDHIAAEVTGRVREMLLEQLGGPSTGLPTAASAEAPTEPATPPRGPVLRIDVIGHVEPEWKQRIRDATGHGDEVHFIDRELAGDFSPHRGRHLVVMQYGRLPRTLTKKLEATGVKAVMVRNAAGHVLRAVQDLKARAAAPTLQ
jgi:hypothetical protein